MCTVDWAVLGTWVQAIGAIGALYFLYMTFKSQEEVLKSQNEILDVQNSTLKEQQQITKLELDKYKDCLLYTSRCV